MSGPGTDESRAELRDDLTAVFGAPSAGCTPLDDTAFDRLARRVFARCFHAVPTYAAYCRARDVTPDSLESWLDIPAVPTAAFKELPLHATDQDRGTTFRTSGTTRGHERRGEHHVADLDLYRASLRPTFEAFLLPDDARLPFLSLMPPARQLPDSSLAFMISEVMASFGAAGSRTFAHVQKNAPAHALAANASIDFDGLEDAVDEASADDRPVLLIGTSAAFIHWLDHLAEVGRRFELPRGSRLMDTGGYKGRGRRIDPAALRRLYRERLGLAASACVNEYGMTELLSQRYDDGLRRTIAGSPEVAATADPPVKAGPAWLRTVAVDPETLEPLPSGSTGILRHVDLANIDSVLAIQTEDFGRVLPDGVVLEGRAPDAPARGCSIAIDLLLEAGP